MHLVTKIISELSLWLAIMTCSEPPFNLTVTKKMLWGTNQ